MAVFKLAVAVLPAVLGTGLLAAALLFEVLRCFRGEILMSIPPLSTSTLLLLPTRVESMASISLIKSNESQVLVTTSVK